jgi:hypothetical protein
MLGVIVLDLPKDQSWTREDSHLVTEHLECHVERWSKVPYRMVVHVDVVPKHLFARALGRDDFTARVVPQRDMWKEEK